MAGRRKLGSANLKTGRLIWPCLAGERGPDGRGKWPYAISYVFLREAQHKYSEFRNIKYMTLNVNNLDLGKKVDIIIANGVLNNAKNIKYTLDKMLEITSEKGKIFIIEQVEESLEMLVSQVFMMKDSSALEEKGGKTFRNTEEWLRLLRDDRIEKIEVFPEKYNIDQRLFILYHK